MERRRFLATFAVGAAAVLTGCAPDNINPACYTPEGCSPLTAAAGLNQYDLLKLAYRDNPPIDRRFAFEVLRAFGRHRSRLWARGLMWPGMQLQRLTTREPDLEQLQVAIVALEAVLEREDDDVAPEDLIGLEVVA